MGCSTRPVTVIYARGLGTWLCARAEIIVRSTATAAGINWTRPTTKEIKVSHSHMCYSNRQYSCSCIWLGDTQTNAWTCIEYAFIHVKEFGEMGQQCKCRLTVRKSMNNVGWINMCDSLIDNRSTYFKHNTCSTLSANFPLVDKAKSFIFPMIRA